MWWRRRKKKREQEIAIATNTAFELVNQGHPFLLIVEVDAMRASVVVGEGLHAISVTNGLAAIAKNNEKFRSALPDLLIDLSKCV